MRVNEYISLHLEETHNDFTTNNFIDDNKTPFHSCFVRSHRIENGKINTAKAPNRQWKYMYAMHVYKTGVI